MSARAIATVVALRVFVGLWHRFYIFQPNKERDENKFKIFIFLYMLSKEFIENAAEKYSAFRPSSATDTKLDITTGDLKDVEKIAFIRGCEFIIKNIQKEV